MTHPICKLVHDSGCQAFLVACPETREALLVDPKVGRGDTLRQVISDFRLKPVAALDTHTHADHLSDSVAFEKEGLTLYMGGRTACRRNLKRLRDGDSVKIGRLEFRVAEAPGHTDDSIALIGHGMAIAGDTLFVGGLARADFRGSDPVALWESVQRVFMTLPDGTVVYPGHNYRDIHLTTVGAERASNPALAYPSAAAYAGALGAVEGEGNTPEVDAMLAMNIAADPELPDSPATVAACCGTGEGVGLAPREPEQTPAELAERREEICARGAWIDVRDAWEFEAEHIPGTRNIPLGELGFELGALRRDGPVVLSCLGGVRSMTAARTLRHLGVLDQPVSMSGGFREWKASGLPTES